MVSGEMVYAAGQILVKSFRVLQTRENTVFMIFSLPKT